MCLRVCVFCGPVHKTWIELDEGQKFRVLGLYSASSCGGNSPKEVETEGLIPLYKNPFSMTSPFP